MKHRFEIGYLSVLALIALGFEACLIEELWLKLMFGAINIIAFMLDIGSTKPEEKNEYIDGKLILFQGEDEQHIALGLTMETDPNVLITKKTTTLEVVNNMNMGGGKNGRDSV